MLQYIQRHIHQPELLKLDLLADKFNISPKYVGRFFKRHFGEDYKQYITKNRLKIVEDMLTNTKMTVKEIAARLLLLEQTVHATLRSHTLTIPSHTFAHVWNDGRIEAKAIQYESPWISPTQSLIPISC